MSSVFVIIQSLSVTSNIRGIMFILMRHFACCMLQFAYDLSVSHSTACHLQKIDVYVDNAILYQLCLLVFQRLALAISPLKVHLLITRKHVAIAVGVTVTLSLIVDTLFAVSVTTTCQENQEHVDCDSPHVCMIYVWHYSQFYFQFVQLSFLCFAQKCSEYLQNRLLSKNSLKQRLLLLFHLCSFMSF